MIIAKVLDGDTAIFAVLVNRYRNMAYTLSYNIILNREDAEEAAQDAFVKMYNALSAFAGQAKFSTWFYRIVVNAALNKRKLRKLAVSVIDDTHEGEVPADPVPLLKHLHTTEYKKILHKAMLALGESERICILLFYLEELTIAEVHAVTGLSQANIKILLFRGRKHLYDELDRLLKTETQNLI